MGKEKDDGNTDMKATDSKARSRLVSAVVLARPLTSTDSYGAGVGFDDDKDQVLVQLSEGLYSSLNTPNSSKQSTVWIQKELVEALLSELGKDEQEYFRLENVKLLRSDVPVGNCDCLKS